MNKYEVKLRYKRDFQIWAASEEMAIFGVQKLMSEDYAYADILDEFDYKAKLVKDKSLTS